MATVAIGLIPHSDIAPPQGRRHALSDVDCCQLLMVWQPITYGSLPILCGLAYVYYMRRVCYLILDTRRAIRVYRPKRKPATYRSVSADFASFNSPDRIRPNASERVTVSTDMNSSVSWEVSPTDSPVAMKE